MDIGEKEEDEVCPGLPMSLWQGKKVLQARPTNRDQAFLNLKAKIRITIITDATVCTFHISEDQN